MENNEKKKKKEETEKDISFIRKESKLLIVL